MLHACVRWRHISIRLFLPQNVATGQKDFSNEAKLHAAVALIKIFCLLAICNVSSKKLYISYAHKHANGVEFGGSFKLEA